MLKYNRVGKCIAAIIIAIWVAGIHLPVLATPKSAQYSSPNVPSSITAYSDIFSDPSVLRFKLILDYKELLRDRGDDREYHPATIQYESESGKSVSVDLKVRTRGKHRRDPNICNFPPLLLNFPKTKVLHTVFAGQDKVKLVTHCLNEDFVIREYLVYKLYNLVTANSFRVRLCEIEYLDTKDSKRSEKSYAFIIEDDEHVAQRNKGALMSDETIIRMDATDDRAMSKLALFQYMIGNTDWSVPYRHNIKLMFLEHEVKIIPIPFDFDYTGIVMPPYAKPPPEIGITSVRQRIFRGYSYPDYIFAELIPFYNNRRAAFYQVYLSSGLLDDSYVKRTISFLDDFYEIINNPKQFEKKIVKVAHRNKKRNVSVKGLD